MLENVFHLKENHTDAKTEIMAGITTFMTMAYILAVNPNILSASGMDSEAVLIATALASFVGTALMALLANYPFALAPGMGLNAYFSYTVVLTMGYSWQLALMAVFVEGIIFIVLSLTNVREGIFNAIPMTLKSAVSVGIGLFVAFVGLQNAKLIVNSDSTLVTYQHFKGETFHSIGVDILGLALVAQNLTHVLQKVGVKAGTGGAPGREADSLDAVVQAEVVRFTCLLAQTVRAVGHHHGRDAQPLDPLRVPEIRAGAKAGFFFQCHLADQCFQIALHILFSLSVIWQRHCTAHSLLAILHSKTYNDYMV